MSVLFGHPTGNPNSHHAALAHFDANRLEAFCVAWMPSLLTLQLLDHLSPSKSMARRLRRRRFPSLADAPTIQDRVGEIRRLINRAIGRDSEAVAWEANDWLMSTMARECRRPAVTAVHAYEDCALSPFVEAKRLGKACIYDMPIGYYPAWEQTQTELARKFSAWLPGASLGSSRHVRPKQKLQEMHLADVVLAPSSFVVETIRKFHPDKALALAPYGVDLEFWNVGEPAERSGTLRFLYAGQISLRKGLPLLLDAWEKAALRSAELHLVGAWRLSRTTRLPDGVVHLPARSSQELREQYRRADVFVFPSYFEGLGLVLLEAIACGLPAIASDATGAQDVLTEECGRVLPVGELDALVAALRWFNDNRERLPAMRLAARKRAEQCTWERYRHCVGEATAGFI